MTHPIFLIDNGIKEAKGVFNRLWAFGNVGLIPLLPDGPSRHARHCVLRKTGDLGRTMESDVEDRYGPLHFMTDG